MNPQPTFLQTLHMLWTGQGLANLLPWLPASPAKVVTTPPAATLRIVWV